MSLRRQFFIILLLSITTLLAASLMAHLYSERQHLMQQIKGRANDTAALLACALVDTSSRTSTTANAAILIDTVFEQGHYDAIIYQNPANKTLAERRKPAQTLAIPAWFAYLLAIPAQTASSNVGPDNAIQGTITVTTSPSQAHQQLWQIFYQQLALYSIIAMVLLAVCHYAIGYFLQPLLRIREQAAAICERRFVEQHPVPKVLELRLVVEALNHMSRKLRSIFQEQLVLAESLRAQTFLDPVTGLSNRRDFNARLQAIADNEADSGGCLMILQVDDFGRYNLKYGHEAGDECLRAIAAQLQNIAKAVPDAIVSRRAGADFAVYLPRADQAQTHSLAEDIITKVRDLAVLFQHRIHIGVSCCVHLRANHRLLAEADLALRQAQSKGDSCWHLYHQDDITQIAQEARQWYGVLNRTLQDRNLTFHFQPLFPSDSEQALAVEVFARISLHDKLVSAGIFLPMAERFGLAESFDRLILDEIRTRAETAKCIVPICVNLSPHSIISRAFIDWLSEYLAEHTTFAQRLIIETAEYLVRTGEEHVRYLCETLHRRGARFSLDHFGVSNAAFGYLKSLPLDFIKLDRSFIRDIHLNPDNQFYVQSLVQIAHTCEITILAEGIENQQEWQRLCQLGIDGGQGYLLARPDSTLNTSRST